MSESELVWVCAVGGGGGGGGGVRHLSDKVVVARSVENWVVQDSHVDEVRSSCLCSPLGRTVDRPGVSAGQWVGGELSSCSDVPLVERSGHGVHEVVGEAEFVVYSSVLRSMVLVIGRSGPVLRVHAFAELEVREGVPGRARDKSFRREPVVEIVGFFLCCLLEFVELLMVVPLVRWWLGIIGSIRF